MDLFIIRHAIAEPRGTERPDEARVLTPDGRKRFQREVEGLRKLGIGFDRIYHSPWLRAAETAELLIPLLKGETRVTPTLAADPGPGLLDELEGDRVAVVGHEPWMSELLTWLAFDQPDLADNVTFKKGGVAWLTGEPRPGAMTLTGFLAPRVLRKC